MHTDSFNCTLTNDSAQTTRCGHFMHIWKAHAAAVEVVCVVTVVRHRQCQVERTMLCSSVCALAGSAWRFITAPTSPERLQPAWRPALLFRAVIGQGPPTELVCSSFVAPRFHSLLKVSLWRDAASAASPSSFTLLRPHTHTQFCSPPFQTLLSWCTSKGRGEKTTR